MFYFVGYRRSENLCPATHYLEDECFMDKKNKLADYAARIKKLGGSDINTHTSHTKKWVKRSKNVGLAT